MSGLVTDMAEEVTNRLGAVKDAKVNLGYQSEKLGRAVMWERERVEESKAALESVKRQGEDQVTSSLELHERWEMRNEELLKLLVSTHADTLQAAAVVRRCSPLLEKMHREQRTWGKLEEVMMICLELLSDSLEFYEKNQDRSASIVSCK